MTPESAPWNSQLQQSSHAFVWEFGHDLLAMLGPKSQERILDVGCGTGQLSAEIAKSGAVPIGLYQSREMIAAANANDPDLHFEGGDVAAAQYDSEFDGVFSNAALHWVRNQQGVIAAIAHTFKPGGGLVFEMGGRGNLQQISNAAVKALTETGVPDPEKLLSWFYPTIGEYAPMLEERGLTVMFAVLFDRTTPLEGGEPGLRNWLEMFARFAGDVLRPRQRNELMSRIEILARPALLRGGVWTVDYKRLRTIAVKQ